MFLSTTSNLHTLFKILTVALLSSLPSLLFADRNRLLDDPSQSEQQRRQHSLSLNGEHAFITPGLGDVRSPCPALNTLANHGYINRSGKGISASSLISALTSIYHLSSPFAATLVAGGVLCCGNIGKGISLDALAQHNKIEHDASLVHDNALSGAKFAPTQVNLTLVDELLRTYPGGMGINELAQARMQREMSMFKEKRLYLNAFHEEIGHGEAALMWLLMKDATNVVNAKTLRQFLGKETFPSTYTIPDEEISLQKAKEVSAEVGNMMKKVKTSIV
ncbi:Chloroperoxidase [Lentinula detonsa]|uniref:Chloroperoxidase n=1 Tax=Lentinula detonsa TaxID=2804962 RepID=A0AA38PTI8_9AGAR|nr:Chloroperoxidase [Lentinula detonsa]